MPVMQEDQASSRVADHAEMLALSLPSFVFSGYELARKTYLPVLLVGAAGLNVAKAGLILTIVGGWGIVVEVLFGMVCDLAPDPHRRRSFWVMTGMALQGVGGLILWLMPQNRTVLGWLLGLLPWASGWVLSNLAHGAWALERSSGVPARGRIFGARAQAGMAGSILFAAALLWSRHDHHGMDDFHVLLWLTLAGSPLVHGWLIWRVKERPTMVPSRPDWGSALKPSRVLMASAADCWLAALFLLVGAHMAVIGSSFLFIARQRLDLAEWGTPGILAQALAAMIGTGIAPGLLRAVAPLRMLIVVFVLNLGLALVLPWLPPGQILPLILWSCGTGATMAVDFMLLRVLLGQRLDRDRQHGGDAPAAAFYAGFHLPFNLGAMIGTALLFHAMAAMGDRGLGLAWLTGALAAVILVAAIGCTFLLRRALCVETSEATPSIELNTRIFKKVKSVF
ncbi:MULTISPECIES: MFS transporter [unclassified Novosphingobium]|uniref:MFS transporter n=1 Tax=unclassified Novosphingobium TaxID=2644732 RepID=UPI00086C42EA|nr:MULTISPECIES: MFS transporter [unclassified Novosphingobium]MDR6707435.1 Na+/melibiose symporter-like transporter [Novosphingobium sp. 1748]ODU83365.1 MAG: hypothetical protein ABT10_07140 [Novosphingobium sp. SCN 63-17]OJX96366.1 MAG: hypothetical protein BGP00_17485 [Novosphingobium sp. 63-713]